MPSKIFISYRRDDSADAAGRLSDNLLAHFDKEQIFMDIDYIEPGEDFVQVITDAVRSCQILIAVIGRNWLNSSKDGSTRRLDYPNDFVRLEIATALSLNVRVIPVLVQGTTMPAPQDLPDEIAALSRRQAFELSHQRWQRDVESLIGSLKRILVKQQEEARQAEEQRQREAIADAQRKREEEEAALRAREKKAEETRRKATEIVLRHVAEARLQAEETKRKEAAEKSALSATTKSIIPMQGEPISMTPNVPPSAPVVSNEPVAQPVTALKRKSLSEWLHEFLQKHRSELFWNGLGILLILMTLLGLVFAAMIGTIK